MSHFTLISACLNTRLSTSYNNQTPSKMVLHIEVGQQGQEIRATVVVLLRFFVSARPLCLTALYRFLTAVYRC